MITTQQDLLDKLKIFDDPDFRFSSSDHKYYYQNDELVSVTTYLKRFTKEFDREYWSLKKSEKTGQSQKEILEEWNQTALRASFLGTSVHQWIENYFCGVYQSLPEDPEIIHRINKFNLIWYKYLRNLTPVCFEKKVFSKKLKLAGTIDSIFMQSGRICIIDWKSNKSFLTDNDTEKCWENLLDPFKDFCKNNLNEYSIQISLYRLILEEADIFIPSGYLVHIGPGDTEPKIYKCKDFVPLLKEHFRL